MQKKVSIVIPLYNHEKYVGFAIESVIGQTYKNIEIIIIDDGSTDGSYEKAMSYQEKYPEKIKLLKQDNMGAHNTINKGISLAIGEYITILNSDDIFKTDKLERCFNIVEKQEEIDIVFGGVDFIDENNKIIKKGTSIDWQRRGLDFMEKSELFPLAILNENIISTTSNMFFKKSIIDEKNKFYSLRYCHDLDFIMSCIKNGKYYYDKDNVHISYRCHESNTLKENIDDIRLEIAAVISVTLVEFKTGIIDKKTENLKYLTEFMNNKKLSNAIIYLMMIYLENHNKDNFYNYIYKKENKEKLYALLA